jgi:ribonuclease P protein component
MQKLKQRADFLKAATGTKVPAAAFVLQARERDPSGPGPVRVGFTVSRKVGNAVKRNRVRRRLREMVRLFGEGRMHGGYDYVLVGRQAALSLPFERMTQDFERALRRAHDGSLKGGSPKDGSRKDQTRQARGAQKNTPAGKPETESR